MVKTCTMCRDDPWAHLIQGEHLKSLLLAVSVARGINFLFLFLMCLHIWISFPGFPKAYFPSLIRISSKCGIRNIQCERKLMMWVVRKCLGGGRQAPSSSH